MGGETLSLRIKEPDLAKEQYQTIGCHLRLSPAFPLQRCLDRSGGSGTLPEERSTPFKQMGSYTRDKDEFALEMTESKHQQCHGLKEILKHEFLKLVRIRDFISLILMYPMKMPDQHLLRKWRDDAQELTAIYSEHIDSFGEKVSEAYHWMHLLCERPLKNMEVLIPNDILSKIEDGHRSIFNENAAILSRGTVDSASTSKGKEVLELTNVHNEIPEAILNLATDLAVDQLIQTLLTCNLHHVMFSTRNEVEKINVQRKIKAALNDECNLTAIRSKYSRVLWVDASKYSSNLEVQVQQEIAQQLDLMTSKGDQTENNISPARLIEVEMMRMNHLVILVDGDGGRKVDPRKVGFLKKMVAGVMVLITVESSMPEHDELTMAMDLEIRTEEHMMPWELFCRKVGRELVFSFSDIQRIAVQIVEGCRGHLLTIVLVARSLMNKQDVELWKLALNKLCSLHPIHANIIHDDNKVMVSAFANIIWRNLNKTEKLCLVCSLYVLRLKENMADHLLISSWVYNKLVCSREEAECILRNLVDRCVLLQFEMKYIQWPEEIYNVLNSLLMSRPLDTIKKGGLRLTELPSTEEWLLARHIELMDNKLRELPPSPTWPKVTRLLLQGNANLMEIPPLFFQLMPHLQVLNLSNTSIRSLPCSFFNLEELRELHLKECKRFMELPPEIRQVKNLKILDLDGTPIIYIPEQIQELTKLRKLILSFYKCHDMMKNLQYLVPPGVISKLTRLRHLSIDVNSVNKYWDENIQVILQDISKLPELHTVSLCIPQVELLKHVPCCLNFRFVVGHHIQKRIISRAPPAVEAKFKQHRCSLRFVNGMNISNDIFKVIQRSKALFLERHQTIINLSQIDMGSLANLQSFIVGECNEMQTLINGGCTPRPDLCWRYLCVFYMNNLRSICEVEAWFYSLKIIALHNCPKLTIIFTLNFLGSLVHLEELVVDDCPKVSTIISLESFESEEGIFLPHLRKVSLLFLPELVSISSGLCIGPTLRRIGLYDCPKLQNLSTKELGSQNLEVIKGEKEWWDALKWEEAEWGKEGWPDYLQDKFSPINEEIDIFDQLFEDDESSTSNKKESCVENLVEIAEKMDLLFVGAEDESSNSKYELPKYMPRSAEGKSDKRTRIEDELHVDAKTGLQKNEALKLRFDDQSLHEQLETQRKVQFRIEEQGRQMTMSDLQQKTWKSDERTHIKEDKKTNIKDLHLPESITGLQKREALQLLEDQSRFYKQLEAKYFESVYEGLKLRKEAEEALRKEREGERMKSENDKVKEELRLALDEKRSLETQIAYFEDMVKDLEQTTRSAVNLSTNYKKERDELKVQRDKALREAQELRKKREASVTRVPRLFSEFSFQEIKQATSNFSLSHLIGSGGSGSVYKGILRHTEVVMKRLPVHNNSLGPAEFLQKVSVLSKLRHPNLVTLIGACPESWTLVYEFVPNGTLEDRLNCKDNTSTLSWQTRIRIAADLCSALIFLHSRPRSLVHGNLKPSKILLGENLSSKLSDFGSFYVSSDPVMLRGTLGYRAPEFFLPGELTTKSDVYAFGIILLRLLTGRPALGITEQVQHALDTGELKSLLDPLAGNWPLVEAEELARLALRCCEINRKSRPDLQSDVWRVLEPMISFSGGTSSFKPGHEGPAQPPPYFICPILREVMRDPHVAADGFTYEAEAIRGWFDSGHDTSPMTNAKLEHFSLVANVALRVAIQEWLQTAEQVSSSYVKL